MIKVNVEPGRKQARLADQKPGNGGAGHDDVRLEDLDRQYAEEAGTGPRPKEQNEAVAVPGDTLLDLSHDGLALDMARGWQVGARHVALWGKWLSWEATTAWRPDEILAQLDRTRAYLRARADSLVRSIKASEENNHASDDSGAGRKDGEMAPLCSNRGSRSQPREK